MTASVDDDVGIGDLRHGANLPAAAQHHRLAGDPDAAAEQAERDEQRAHHLQAAALIGKGERVGVVRGLRRRCRSPSRADRIRILAVRVFSCRRRGVFRRGRGG